MPHFFYLCYSLKPTARDKWLGYISESWRGFLLSIDPKSKAVWSYSFSGHRNGPLGEIFRKGLTKSRRLSGAALFQVVALDRLGSLAIGVERQPEVVWPERLFGVHFQRLEWLFAEDLPKAGGGLA